MLSSTGIPIIGLTIRHDRLDNFWHTLVHELAHVCRHLRNPEDAYVDNFDVDSVNIAVEKEADILARNSFIPREEWEQSVAFRQPSIVSIFKCAEMWKIHAAIVAGRIRYETRDYSQFGPIVGHGLVRKFFSTINWP
jgi:HTH-type transcriptional regulator/antitoxin HigA